MPSKVCRSAEIRHSSKARTEYEVADGGVAMNMGEKFYEMMINQDDTSGMEFPLQAVDCWGSVPLP